LERVFGAWVDPVRQVSEGDGEHLTNRGAKKSLAPLWPQPADPEK
jgi:hypothetical protein